MKLKHDKLLSKLAFNCNLRPCIKDGDWIETGLHIFFGAYPNMVGRGRCSFTLD